jgi:hypothetical protein
MKAKAIKLKTAKKSAGSISRSKVRKVVAAVYAGAVSPARFTEVFVSAQPATSSHKGR